MNKRKYTVFSILASCGVLHMKAILSILLCCACAVGAEYVTLHRPVGVRTSQIKTIAANETVKFAFHDFWDTSNDYVFFLKDGDEFPFGYGDYTFRTEKRIPILQGPGVLLITNAYSGASAPSRSSFATFELIKNSPETSLTTPSTAVVIPEDATGSVQIILESSTDLVTWTAANPGTYGASTTKRFFRVRAVKQ